MSLFKNFPLREGRWTAQFRVEAFNATNTTQFTAPGSQVGNSSLGVISGAVAARQVQLALKVIW